MAAHWIVLLIVLVPLWLLQNVIHELSHGLTLWAGWRWGFKIWPFPSKKLGRFTFAHVIYHRTEESKDPDNKGWALIAIMPRITNVVLITLALVPSMLISNKAIAMPFLIFMWTNLIDMCVGLLTSLKSPNKADIWVFQDKLQVPTDHLRYICVSVSTLFAIMVGVVSVMYFI